MTRQFNRLSLRGADVDINKHPEAATNQHNPRRAPLPPNLFDPETYRDDPQVAARDIEQFKPDPNDGLPPSYL